MNASSSTSNPAGWRKLAGWPLRLVQTSCLLTAAGLVVAGGASLLAAWSESQTRTGADSWPTAVGRATSASVEALPVRSATPSAAGPEHRYVVVLEYRYPTPAGERHGIADAPRQAEDSMRKEQAEAVAAAYRTRPEVEVYWDPKHPSESRLDREPASPGLLFLMAGMGGVTLLGGAGLACCSVLLLPRAAA